ncbi:zinc finger protein 364 [Danaus plexippus plexippus]|uniref:Zinc finger protein 364 n=1 Tax=Danaus plexippus plexippus TaxID=278856 RepID=A0A212FIM2_DANPL|nr:E3 ubiquitin ligase BIG BROTHER-related-like [Danaus plexippus plexippus]OWR53571.1 zinc finger protein 364 [Danaus plexippus plexippus]
MSFREEDNQRNCPSRGLGLAAAAIGVGVGAALYYFFSKRPEHPTPSGSTSEAWHCETERAFLEENSSDDYSTISEHSTTDTSINEDSENFCNCSNICSDESETETEYSETDSSQASIESSLSTEDSDRSLDSNGDTNDLMSRVNDVIDSALNESSGLVEWDVTSTLDVPSFTPTFNNQLNSFLTSLFSPRRSTSRERSRTEEQCSICFDMIQPSQECMALPCTHFFHTTCILPWLEQQQTCPNCRKNID